VSGDWRDGGGDVAGLKHQEVHLVVP
jgi:hypothetical protein